MFELLLQVMSNDGFEVIICSATQTSFNGVNNTGGEANLKKCMLLCLIQTSVTLAIIKARKENYFERYCLGGHFKSSRCGRLWRYYFRTSCRINNFRKRLEYQYFSTRHSVLYHHTRFLGSHISNFRLG